MWCKPSLAKSEAGYGDEHGYEISPYRQSHCAGRTRQRTGLNHNHRDLYVAGTLIRGVLGTPSGSQDTRKMVLQGGRLFTRGFNRVIERIE